MKNIGIPHEIVLAAEIDKYARETYLANHYTKKMVNDMTEPDYIGEEYYSDLNVSGLPCQSFSLAGKRLGELDPRGLLFFDFLRYVKNQNPKYFIIENVKGLLSMDDGEVFRNWIQLLGQSENGNTFMFPHEDSLMYNLHWQVLNTKDYGLPQNRERVFLVGIRNDLPNSFVFPKGVPLKLRLKDILEDEVDEKYYLKESTIKAFEFFNTSGNQIGKIGGEVSKHHNSITNRIFSPENLCPTLTTASTGGNQEIKILVENIGNVNPSGNGMNGNVFSDEVLCPTLTTNKGEGIKIQIQSATKSGYEIATEGNSINLEHPNSETRRGRVGKQVAQTLTTSCNQGVMVVGFERTEEAKMKRSKSIKENGIDTGNFSDRKLKLKDQDYSDTILANPNHQKEGLIAEFKIGAMRGRNPDNPNDRSKGGNYQQTLEINENGTSNCLSTVQKDNLVIEPQLKQVAQLEGFESEGRIYDVNGISRTIKDGGGGGSKTGWYQTENFRIRKLTPLEAFRLQGFDDSFVKPVSNSQLYKQAGNTISVNVIQAILKNLLK